MNLTTDRRPTNGRTRPAPNRRRALPYTIIAAAVLTVISFFSGCGLKTEGWGVILWSHDETAFPTGSLVPVVGSSLLNMTYDIRFDRDSALATVPQWKLTVFKRKSQAEELVAEYAQYSELYAVANLNGLPVRETQDPDAKRVYKLRVGEAVKVLGQDALESTAGEYTGYWYRVLTDGGVTGYSFGRYLDVYTADELANLDLSEKTDEFLEHFLTHNFRPKYFRTMLVTRRMDLNRFLPVYGVFPDTENQLLEIVTEEHVTTIEYTAIVSGNDNSYAFEGSTLLMIMKTDYEVNFQYADQGVQYSEDFVRIDPDIDLLVTEELARRADKVQTFYGRGNILESSAYGTITLTEGGGFVWEGLDRLVPDVVSPLAGFSGMIDFQLHPATKVMETYDGVISFLFANDETAHFLYSLQPQGLRFKHLQWPEDSEDLLVEDEGNSPIVIFFRVSNQDIE
jgi:hypothetical protein